MQIRNVITKACQEEAREKLILAAFVGWQLGAGGEKAKTFRDYLVGLGLLKERQGETEPGMVSDEALFAQIGMKVKKVKREAS